MAANHAAAGWKVETIAAAAGIEVAEVEKILGRAAASVGEGENSGGTVRQ